MSKRSPDILTKERALKKTHFLKPNKLIDCSFSIDLGKHDLLLFNALMAFWQMQQNENLFNSLESEVLISHATLIKKMGIAKENASKEVSKGLTFMDSLFKNLKECTLTLYDCVLPLTASNGDLILDKEGNIEYKRYKKFSFNILDVWGIYDHPSFEEERERRDKIYIFKLSSMMKGLSHIQTLITQNNYIGYTRLDFSLLTRLKSVRTIRLYEYVMRNKYRSSDMGMFTMESNELKSILILEESTQIKAVNQALNRTIAQLSDLVEIRYTMQKGINGKFLYYNFEFNLYPTK